MLGHPEPMDKWVEWKAMGVGWRAGPLRVRGQGKGTSKGLQPLRPLVFANSPWAALAPALCPFSS